VENNTRATEIEEEHGKNVETYLDLSYSTKILLVATPYVPPSANVKERILSY